MYEALKKRQADGVPLMEHRVFLRIVDEEKEKHS